MHNHYILPLILCTTLLAACSDNKDAKTENVFQGQVDSLNKAKKVEETLLKADQQQRKTIDEQSK